MNYPELRVGKHSFDGKTFSTALFDKKRRVVAVIYGSHQDVYAQIFASSFKMLELIEKSKITLDRASKMIEEDREKSKVEKENEHGGSSEETEKEKEEGK